MVDTLVPVLINNGLKGTSHETLETIIKILVGWIFLDPFDRLLNFFVVQRARPAIKISSLTMVRTKENKRVERIPELKKKNKPEASVRWT